MLLPRTGTQHFLLDTYQAKGECEILGGEPEKILATAHPVLGDARLPKLMRQKPASVQFSKKCAERRQLSCSPLPRYPTADPAILLAILARPGVAERFPPSRTEIANSNRVKVQLYTNSGTYSLRIVG